MILLDTDVLSALRRPERHPRVAAWLMSQDEGALFVSAVTIGEIARGVALEARRNPAAGAVLADWLDRTCLQFADRILAFDAEAAGVRHFRPRFSGTRTVSLWVINNLAFARG
ncbi:PIN domain-containing protein [Rubrimonas cliftonensis]|uniref:PIN domain-containing protein n=1 Tax=Rubrimonas cliftonensis TaxID=89524 RepID=A0A1H4FTP0_9RHOB|nr:PIN domain-containing protein [Rubrimonas cliftonensis]SEB00675.1 hypothetical protein SAMN05444370_12825 [Rubrimonas cliftonensis]